MKVFVIMRIGWEYNDKYYYTYGESDNEGIPIKAYKDRASAEAACLEANIETYRSICESKYSSLGSYFDGYDGFNLSEGAKDRLKKLGVNLDENQSWIDIPKDLSDEEMADVIQSLGVVFYEVAPTEFIE